MAIFWKVETSTNDSKHASIHAYRWKVSYKGHTRQGTTIFLLSTRCLFFELINFYSLNEMRWRVASNYIVLDIT